MYLNRIVDIELEKWRQSEERKPLMIRGARQVGKSSSVRNLGAKFKYFIELNFDENSQFNVLFEQNLSIDEICDQLSIITNTPIIDGETLVFLDEIQTSVAAIGSLRYFYEKRPNLHLISAGSLLEFALAEIPSFGVGRVRSIFMYPLSFTEFLLAQNENLLLDSLLKASITKPLGGLIHQKLISYYKLFLIIGGMPEAVSVYTKTKSLHDVQDVLNDLITSIQADFTKYKKQVPALRITEVFSSIVNQNGTKFTYSYPNASLNNLQIKQVLDLLEMAGLVYPVVHSSSNGLPLAAEMNIKKTKFMIYDTGIFQRILGLNISELFLANTLEVVNRGGIAELFVGLELLKSQSCFEKSNLFYWQREAKNSQAEVDFVVQVNAEILPIEVKSGKKGSMQSLFLFLNEKNKSKGLRLSLENFSVIPQVDILPIYAAFRIRTIYVNAI